MGSVTPRCCPFAGIPGRPAAAMKRGSRERGKKNPPKPQHEERRDQQIKLHRRSLGPVRPCVRPSFRGRSRSPARLVKRRKRRINTKTHTKRHSKAPSCCLPKTTAKSDTKVAANRETSGAEGAARTNKGGREERNKKEKTRGKGCNGTATWWSRPVRTRDQLHATAYNWVAGPPTRNRSGQRGNTYLPGHRETGCDKPTSRFHVSSDGRLLS